MDFSHRFRSTGKSVLLICILLFAGCEWPLLPRDNSGIAALNLLLSDDALIRIRKTAFVNQWVAARVKTDSGFVPGRLRIHGNVTRYDPQKGFKLEVFAGYPVRVVEASILTPQMSDASFCRYRLAAWFFGKTDLLNPRIHVRRLFINNLFEGLYLKLEEVDEMFFLRRNLPVSSLYKINVRGRFTMKNGSFPQQIFDKKLPDDNMVYEDVRRLIAILDRGLASENTDELEGMLDVYNTLDYLAVSILTSNGDGVVNNFYLWFNSKTGLFEFIPWDLNRTFDDPPTVYPDYKNGLFEKLRAIPRYEKYLMQRMEEIFDYEEAVNKLYELYDFTIDAQLKNPYLPLIEPAPNESLDQIKKYLAQLDSVLQEGI